MRNPEASVFDNQMTQNSGREDDHDMVTGVQRESLCDHDMATRATEQIPSRQDMTGVHEEVAYCCRSTSSGKQKLNHSTRQPQFRSENTPATNEADPSAVGKQQHFCNFP